MRNQPERRHAVRASWRRSCAPGRTTRANPPAGARAWDDAARGLSRLRALPGDHFFRVPWAAEISGAIAATVAESLNASSGTAS
ncbi:hypothetical protein AB0C52_25225 [Streptomyces sp. NPDC048717]|uniref:hypothetical protein n=1 Tax=Streptomyces sp. NPDC048717 TaxID=3154928 RepID=UPI00343A873F